MYPAAITGHGIRTIVNKILFIVDESPHRWIARIGMKTDAHIVELTLGNKEDYALFRTHLGRVEVARSSI